MVDPVNVVELRAIARRQQVRNWLALVAAFVSCVALVIVAGLAFTLSSSIGDIHNLQRHGDCRAQIEAQFFTATADAFNSPPAPNPARAQAVLELKRAGARLHDIEKVCA